MKIEIPKEIKSKTLKVEFSSEQYKNNKAKIIEAKQNICPSSEIFV